MSVCHLPPYKRVNNQVFSKNHRVMQDKKDTKINQDNKNKEQICLEEQDCMQMVRWSCERMSQLQNHRRSSEVDDRWRKICKIMQWKLSFNTHQFISSPEFGKAKENQSDIIVNRNTSEDKQYVQIQELSLLRKKVKLDKPINSQ